MLDPGFQFRRIELSDGDDLAHFFANNNKAEITRFFHPFPLVRESAQKLSGYQGLDRYFVLLSGKTIVGFGMLRGWDEGFDVPSFGILIDHAHQKKGFGRILSELMLEEAKKQGASKVRLKVHSTNTGAISLYKKLGFKLHSSLEPDEEGGSYLMFKDFYDV